MKTLKVMEESLLQEIINLDNICFSRSSTPRTEENIKMLIKSNPNGCLALREKDRLIGYAFTRIEGSLGFIGPIGVHPDFRGGGYGKKLIEKCVEALQKNDCTMIGLETLPEWGDRLGLYQKLGFTLTYPTVLYEEENVEPVTIHQERIVLGKKVLREDVDTFLGEMYVENCGYMLRSDVEQVLEMAPGNISFYYVNDRIEGVMYYYEELYPLAGAAFLKNEENLDYFIEMLQYMEILLDVRYIPFRVNARYKKSNDLINRGFRVRRCYARLMYRECEGIFEFPEKDGFVARAWVG